VVYTWARTGTSTFTFPGSASALLNSTVTIPANARLVKLLGYHTVVDFNQAGSNQTALGLWSHFLQLKFTAGPYAGRIIRDERIALDQGYTVFFNALINQASYTMFTNTGDERLGFDQKCSYGGKGKAASTLQILTSLNEDAPAMSPTVNNFYYGYNFGALYEL
jgi:hypothetical protein